MSIKTKTKTKRKRNNLILNISYLAFDRLFIILKVSFDQMYPLIGNWSNLQWVSIINIFNNNMLYRISNLIILIKNNDITITKISFLSRHNFG